ncbi:MAG: polysaccharide deacetylase family protein [Isosphaeraceae bacterium]
MPAASLLRTARSLARAPLSAIPLGVWQNVFPKDVIALGYHVVSDDRLLHQKYYPFKNRSQFEADVAFAAERLRPVSYPEVEHRRLGHGKLPPRAVLFTFDDGFAECFDVIRPILLEHGVKGTFFITSSFVNDRSLFFETKVSLAVAAVEQLTDGEAAERLGLLGRLDPIRRATAERRLSNATIRTPLSMAHRELILGLLAFDQTEEAEIERACEGLGVDIDAYARGRRLYLTCEQIRQLAADGFTIGGHGLAHRPLQQMHPTEIEQEIVRSCEFVREVSGQSTVPFAFPYSGEGIDRRLLGEIRERHPFLGMIFDTQSLRRELPFIVDRVAADTPPADPHGTNLPQLLSQAWSHRQAWFRA